MQPIKRYQKPAPEKYTDEFKRHAVARACSPTTTRTAVAKQLNIPKTTLAKWCANYLSEQEFFASTEQGLGQLAQHPQEQTQQSAPKAEHPEKVTLTLSNNIYIVQITRATEMHTAIFDVNFKQQTSFTLDLTA